MTIKNLKEKIKSHKQWLDNEGGVRLDLSSVNLSHVNLSNGNLNGLREEWGRDGELRSRAIYKDGVVVE